MRLLQRNSTGEFSPTEFGDEAIPPYAILSHTWGVDTDEPTFEDLTNGIGKDKTGYEKIRFCGEQAEHDGLQYFWIDTCCINKGNYAELEHAINSMFRWYRRSTRCYVYLSDVSTLDIKSSDDKNIYSAFSRFIPPMFRRNHNLTSPIESSNEHNLQPWEADFRKSRWFTRGWTLQELLAPASVEFFSRECKRLGDKSELEQLIHEITGIPKAALQGRPLSEFSINARESWINPRQTKLEEDRAYSLLGILGVNVALRYGEGMTTAFRRLQEEVEKQQKCIRDVRLQDPRDDKRRIEDTKGGLLNGCYQWILGNSDFQQWRNDHRSLLWIKGDPGKGKTMLLCGIIDELKDSMGKTALLSYFFCQATDSKINNATAVLRGLIYMLVCQQPSLTSHIQRKYDHAGKDLFDDTNAWIALSEIFSNMLQDSSLEDVYLIIDALDECVVGLSELLGLIGQLSSVSHVKWILSSRNWPSIEKDLDTATRKVRLCLELNEKSVSAAVTTYIQLKVNKLAERNKYDNSTRDAVLRYLSRNASGTFLWVALVCQELAKISEWDDAEELSKTFPPGLDSLYNRMLDDMNSSKHAKLCQSMLAVVSTVRRPITLDELTSFVDIPARRLSNFKALAETVELCGSFLALRERTIFFVHQSAKDFLVEKKYNQIYPFGLQSAHHDIFLRSLQVMSKKLRRDIYKLDAIGLPIDQVKQPDPDPMSPAQYSCVYWIDHLLDCDPARNASKDLQDGGTVDKFMREKYLYWLEALSLCKSMSKGVASMAKLETLVNGRADATKFIELIRDARRFIMAHKGAIENSPLQAYASALLFSPTGSLIRGLFKKEEPDWITIKPGMGEKWSACIATLEGHSERVSSVAFSHDSTRLASASYDGTVKIWDASSGACIATLEGHSHGVTSIAFSHDSTQLASASGDGTVKIWDASSGASSGACIATLEGHSDGVTSVAFSHDSTRLASASCDGTVKIWDASSGACLQALSIGKALYSISFDITDSHLNTEIGTIEFCPLTEDSVSFPTVSEPSNPQYRGPTVSTDNIWIGYGPENLVWLPSEYRPSCSAVSGKTVGIGVGSGRVWMCEVRLRTS